MNEFYILNQLMRYYYKECDILESLEIEDAIENDSKWHQLFVEIKNSLQALPRVQFRPSDLAVKSILAYSAATSPLVV